jgi:hypothetical protein
LAFEVLAPIHINNVGWGIGMNKQNSKWQTKEIAQTYVEGVRGAIPGANLQLEVIGKIVSAWCLLPSKKMIL